VGYWIPLQSDPQLSISAENTFIYIRGYPSKEERDKRRKAMSDDPERTEVVLKAGANPETRLIMKVQNIDMAPTAPTRHSHQVESASGPCAILQPDL
jgi:hypothetical protein